MGLLEIKLKHEKSDFFKEHFDEVLDLIKTRNLSEKFDPMYDKGLFVPITLEKVESYFSMIIVEVDYSDLFSVYTQVTKPYSKLVATIDFFKDPKAKTFVYEFTDRGFPEKIGIYNDDWEKPGFRWKDQEAYVSEEEEISYDIFDQNDDLHRVNLGYKLARDVEEHLKIKRYHLDPSDKERNLLQEYLNYLKPITDPRTMEAYKKLKG